MNTKPEKETDLEKTQREEQEKSMKEQAKLQKQQAEELGVEPSEKPKGK